MASPCCKCKTEFVEEHRFADLYLELDDPNGIVSPRPVLPSYCKWKFEYDGGKPQNKITVYSDQQCYRNLFSGPIGNCDCINASGGKAGDYTATKTEEFDAGLITKRFPGRIVITEGACFGGRSMKLHQYRKILKIKHFDIDYKNDHFCGKDCPGAPWPQGRKIDKVDYWKGIARGYQG